MQRSTSSLINENSKLKQTTCLKRGKTWVTKLVLVLVLHLIVWDDSARYTDQSQRDVKQKTKAFQDHFRNSIENCSTLNHYGDDRLETRQIVLVIVRANRRKWVNCEGVPDIYIYIYAAAPFFHLSFLPALLSRHLY